MMGAILPEFLEFDFMRNALAAVLLLCPLLALLGCMVVHNQMAFFSEAVGHSALTGIAIGALVGWGDPMGAMLALALVMSAGVSLFRRWSGVSADTVIGLLMAFFVALGVMLLSRGGGFSKYARFLVGDLLTVTRGDLGLLGGALLAVLAIWVAFFNRIFLVSLQRSVARSRGVRAWLIESLFTALVAVVVTLSIPWAGLLVINSLLILPAAAARNVARNTARYVGWSVLFSALSGVGGVVASYYWGTATGATVVLICMGFFILTLALKRARQPV